MRALKMAAATVWTAGMLQAEAPKPESKIEVFVYNYAGVPSETLAQAEREAARIYQHAGINIQWLDCPLAPKDTGQFPACQIPPGPTRLALRIRKVMLRRWAEREMSLKDKSMSQNVNH